MGAMVAPIFILYSLWFIQRYKKHRPIFCGLFRLTSNLYDHSYLITAQEVMGLNPVEVTSV